MSNRLNRVASKFALTRYWRNREMFTAADMCAAVNCGVSEVRRALDTLHDSGKLEKREVNGGMAYRVKGPNLLTMPWDASTCDRLRAGEEL